MLRSHLGTCRWDGVHFGNSQVLLRVEVASNLACGTNSAPTQETFPSKFQEVNEEDQQLESSEKTSLGDFSNWATVTRFSKRPENQGQNRLL